MTEKERDLLEYAKSGNIDEINKLIEEGININIKNNEGITPLHNAMEWLPHLKNKDFLKLAELFVKNNAEINSKDNWGATPLYLAAKEGFYETVVFLHKNGADINIPLNNGFSHLHEIGNKMGPGFINEKLTVIENGEKKIITDNDKIREIRGETLQDEFTGYVLTAGYLVGNGANINQLETKNNQPPLFNACDHGSLELVKILIKNGINNINFQDKFGFTALHYAARKGYIEIADILIKSGANPKAQELYGFTPLHEAAENDNTEMLKFLLDNGADPNIGLLKDFDKYIKGDKAIDVAKKYNRKKAVKFLEEYK